MNEILKRKQEHEKAVATWEAKHKNDYSAEAKEQRSANDYMSGYWNASFDLGHEPIKRFAIK